MNKEGYKKTAIAASVYAVLALSVMFYRAGTKRIIIADAAENDYYSETTLDSYSLRARQPMGAEEEGALIIPLPGGVHSENVRLENRYIEHRIVLFIDAKDVAFYQTNPLVADIDNLESAICIPQNEEGEVALVFQLDGLYESFSELTDNSIVIRFADPKDIYEHIVVVDPLQGGEFLGACSDNIVEKDVNLNIALELKKLTDEDADESFKIFFTRTSDVYRDDELKLDFIEETGADMYIQLTADSDLEVSEGVASYYNSTYFIRNFGNLDFANTIESNVVATASANARGLAELEDETSIIKDVKIPATVLSVGNVMQESDAKRLGDSKYISKVAQGIYNGIILSIAKMDE